MKKARIIPFISLFIVLALITTLIFLTIPDGRTDTTVFWIAWSFAIPFNLVVGTILHFWSCKKSAQEMVHMPIAYYLIITFGIIYLVVGFIFMYLPIKKTLFLIILEIIITVAYLLTAIYFMFGANYMAKDAKHVRQKVLFVKMLTADLEDCLLRAKSGAVRSALQKFVDDVRFSDPMSDPSLDGIEQQLSNTVLDLSMKIDSASEEDVLAVIKQGELQLQSRNRRCMMLK